MLLPRWWFWLAARRCGSQMKGITRFRLNFHLLFPLCRWLEHFKGNTERRKKIEIFSTDSDDVVGGVVCSLKQEFPLRIFYNFTFFSSAIQERCFLVTQWAQFIHSKMLANSLIANFNSSARWSWEKKNFRNFNALFSLTFALKNLIIEFIFRVFHFTANENNELWEKFSLEQQPHGKKQLNSVTRKSKNIFHEFLIVQRRIETRESFISDFYRFVRWIFVCKRGTLGKLRSSSESLSLIAIIIITQHLRKDWNGESGTRDFEIRSSLSFHLDPNWA